MDNNGQIAQIPTSAVPVTSAMPVASTTDATPASGASDGGIDGVPTTPGVVSDSDTGGASVTPGVAPVAVASSAPAPNPNDPKSLKMEYLLEQTINRKASDLHIQVGLPPMLRIDGVLRPMENTPVVTPEVSETLIFSTMDKIQQQSLMKDREYDYSFAFGKLGRFRANAFQEKGNFAVALRLIPDKISSIEELGMPKVVDTFSEFPRGLVLVTGPTGSGKSTTLAAIVEKINQTKPVHILTIEDPIEFAYTSKKAVVVQREVHYDTMSFARALKSSLRQDPDVVLIGEMRDLETIQAALTVAETGHLVFGTLHTNSAAQSIDRVIDVFPSDQQNQIRLQLAAVLQAVCSQRLVPAVAGGRVCAAEIMVINQAIKSLIREGKTHQIDTAIQTGVAQGMQTMDRTLAKMVQNGTITFEDAKECAVDMNEFERLAKGR